MRIEKTQNLDAASQAQSNVRAAQTPDSNAAAERVAAGKPKGDLAALTQELKSTRYDINRQALLQQVKRRLASGDYHGIKSAEDTATAILNYLDARIPRG